MKKLFIILSLCLFICGCGQDKNAEMQKLMAENEYIIVDVRTKEEYNRGHIEESINIPYSEIDETVEISKDTLVFVYCQSGNRSKYADEIFTNLGYTVYDLGAYADIDLPKTDDKD